MTVSVEAADFQTFVYTIELYEGVRLLSDQYLYAEHTIHEFTSHWQPLEARSYNLTAIATDNYGNQSRHTITVYGEGP